MEGDRVTMEPWQTTLEVFADFPYRCVADKWDIDVFEPLIEKGQETMVFNCEYFNSYRIADFECIGDACPMCKLAGHEEYIRRIKEA